MTTPAKKAEKKLDTARLARVTQEGQWTEAVVTEGLTRQTLNEIITAAVAFRLHLGSLLDISSFSILFATSIDCRDRT
jgi:hypothetical protein